MTTQFERTNKDVSPSSKSWDSRSRLIEEPEKSCSGGGFDCNICLDSVNDPVVTFCGHLYCWPCIYKWIHSSDNSATHDKQESQCPVCKAEVSEKTMIPLFGLKTKSSDEEKTIVVPQRPYAPKYMFSPRETNNSNPSQQRSYPQSNQEYRRNPNGDMPVLDIGGSIMSTGEIIYSRFFENQESTLYTYPNSYDQESNYANPRLRRYVMKVDRSLSRICFFLFCFAIMCLLLF